MSSKYTRLLMEDVWPGYESFLGELKQSSQIRLISSALSPEEPGMTLLLIAGSALADIQGDDRIALRIRLTRLDRHLHATVEAHIQGSGWSLVFEDTIDDDPQQVLLLAKTASCVHTLVSFEEIAEKRLEASREAQIRAEQKRIEKDLEEEKVFAAKRRLSASRVPAPLLTKAQLERLREIAISGEVDPTPAAIVASAQSFDDLHTEEARELCWQLQRAVPHSSAVPEPPPGYLDGLVTKHTDFYDDVAKAYDSQAKPPPDKK